eukprot:m.585090 g.585090  ORF g.585090 m.585090 type:complete len:238 (-) comp22339_c1_seq87:2153-2866(-)
MHSPSPIFLCRCQQCCKIVVTHPRRNALTVLWTGPSRRSVSTPAGHGDDDEGDGMFDLRLEEDVLHEDFPLRSATDYQEHDDMMHNRTTLTSEAYGIGSDATGVSRANSMPFSVRAASDDFDFLDGLHAHPSGCFASSDVSRSGTRVLRTASTLSTASAVCGRNDTDTYTALEAFDDERLHPRRAAADERAPLGNTGDGNVRVELPVIAVHSSESADETEPLQTPTPKTVTGHSGNE